MYLSTDVLKRVNKWLTDNYDDETKIAIQQLLNNNETEELNDAFYKDLEFGTGGLRGIMGVGSNRVNKYTIGAATQGLCNYLNSQYPEEQIKVAIAHDNRNNATFLAQITADVFSANDIHVYFFDGLRPTPELSFAIRELGCKSGVMLTASHNPKEYSGYKAYWKDGGQVTPPHDKNIIEEVSKITSISQIKFEGNIEKIERIGEQMDKLFIKAVVSKMLNPEIIQQQHDLKIVYTPIHGTGVSIIPRALREVGFTNIILVDEQCIIDGNFPTVIYPNPEEEEAMAMAIDKAQKTDAELVMATDPDGDRVGIAVKNNSQEFELLNGNQTATLIFHYLIEQWKQKELIEGDEYIVKTIVTTYLVDKIAEANNIKCYNVLTGFKYIGAIMTAIQDKATFIAGAEESYGYLIGDHVRDKDAVVACCIIAEMCAYYRSKGRSLYQTLLDVYVKYGFYKEALISITKAGQKGADEISELMNLYREKPPTALGGKKVVSIKDYKYSKERNLETGAVTPIDLPQSDVLQFITVDGCIITARPSGTEPKIKFYISVNTVLESLDDYQAKETGLLELIKSMEKDLI